MNVCNNCQKPVEAEWMDLCKDCYGNKNANIKAKVMFKGQILNQVFRYAIEGGWNLERTDIQQNVFELTKEIYQLGLKEGFLEW